MSIARILGWCLLFLISLSEWVCNVIAVDIAVFLAFITLTYFSNLFLFTSRVSYVSGFQVNCWDHLRRLNLSLSTDSSSLSVGQKKTTCWCCELSLTLPWLYRITQLPQSMLILCNCFIFYFVPLIFFCKWAQPFIVI